MLDRFLAKGLGTLTWLGQWTPLYLGFLCGSMLCLWWSQTLAAFGGSLAKISGLGVASAIAAAWAWSRPRRSSPVGGGVQLLTLGAWTMILPLVAQWALSSLRFVPAEAFASSSGQFLLSFALGGVLLGPPHFCLALLAPWRAAGDPWRCASPTWRVHPAWAGLGAALLAVPTWLAPQWGVFPLAVATSGFAIVWGCVLLLGQSAGAPADVAPRAEPRSAGSLSGSRLLLPIAAGGLLALSDRITAQLWVQGLYCGFAAAAGIVFGMAAVRAYGRRCGWAGGPRNSTAMILGMWTAAAAAVLAGGFPLWTDISLWVAANVSSTAVVLGLRAGGCALAAAPAGVVLGGSLMQAGGPDGGARRSIALLMMVLGWVFARWWAPEVVPLSIGLIAASSGLAGMEWLRSRCPLPTRRLSWASLATLTTAGMLGAIGIRSYDPPRAARLLFSTQVAAAASSAADRELLRALDDSRVIASTEGRESTWTVWKGRGELVQWRENGLPHGQICAAPSVAPESPAELMTAGIPLAVHPRPDAILVVGLGSSATLRSCLEFPIQSLDCWEPDEGLVTQVRRMVCGPAAAFLQDPRLTLVPCDPLLASAARIDRRYDVIILNDRPLTGARAVGVRNVEAYLRWKDHLAAGGLLCQRIVYADLGSDALADLVQTMRAAFPQVLIWESAPGELLFLASCVETPLIDADVLARFESPQVRRLFGRVGWDCSLPLGLVTAYAKDVFAKFDGGATAVRACDAGFEYQLPAEIARWGAKGAEVQRLLTPAARTAVSRVEDCGERVSIQQRLADVAEHRSLLTRFPDHYWAYRKILRERLQERPRSVIQQLKHELHPDDERRRDYLEALGAAATAKSPTLAQLEAVCKFAEPFDPLLTPFLHQEVARLMTRTTSASPAAELAHRLRSIYFSPGYDRSIRDTTAALSLLLEHPEALEDDTRRWDHINSLLEVLKQRWTLRSQQSGLSRFEAADVVATMDVSQAAVRYLQANAVRSGIDAEWADIRCRVLDRTLVRALRSYHAKHVVKLQELERRKAAAEQSNVAPQKAGLPETRR